MKLIKPSFEILEMTDIGLIEKAGRTCYKSEERMTENSAEAFIRQMDERGHHAMLEHSFASVRVVCDRGVMHEIVRHRLFAYAQESTRYCDYRKDKFGKQVTFILPPWVDIEEGVYSKENIPAFSTDADKKWFVSCFTAESSYFDLLLGGWTAQQARSVLPNSLKTEIVISGNFREWKHFFTLRTAHAAHPQMREIAIPICEEFEKRIPSIKWRA